MTPEEAAATAEALYLKIFTQSTQAAIIELLAAALLEAARSKWQPIETAPLTDWILGLPVDYLDYQPWHASTQLLIVRWREATDVSEEGWRDMEGFRYTLISWMPLPKLPEVVREDDAEKGRQ